MRKRALSFFLAFIMILGIVPAPAAFAAGSEEEALGEIQVYHDGRKMSYLSINGRVREQTFTYYNNVNEFGEDIRIPAYCVNPNTAGVPQTVPAGSSIKYMANEIASDPKVLGIVASGYPHRELAALGLSDEYEAYYATKMALWCYLLDNWDISNLVVNPSADAAAAQRVLNAAKEIYQTGMYWTSILSPHLTVTVDHDTAYTTTVGGADYLQQVYTVKTATWANRQLSVFFKDPGEVPAGTILANMDNEEISSIALQTREDGGWTGKFKILYPADSVEGESGSVQIGMGVDVQKYAVFYASCAESGTYGELQNYMVDTASEQYMDLDTMSQYTSDPDDPPPDDPPPDDPPPDDPPPDDPPPDDPPPEEPEPGSLRIVKRESGTTIPLSGALFKVIGPNGDTIGSFPTDDEGKIELPEVEAGNYTICEIEPPKNYLLGKVNVQNVTVPEGGTGEVTFENDPYGDLRVEKVSDTGDGLAGVVVEIKHIESGQTYSGTTEPGGAVQFTKLVPGAYEVREVSGIKGWVADTTTVKTVTVVTGQTSTATFTNKEKPGLKIEKYDTSDRKALADITFRIWRNGSLLGDYKTGQMGEILLTDLEPGTYVVQEQFSDNDHLVDDTPQQVELQAGDGIKQLMFYIFGEKQLKCQAI